MKKELSKLALPILIIIALFKSTFAYSRDFTQQRIITDPYKSWVIVFNQSYDYEFLLEHVENDHIVSNSMKVLGRLAGTVNLKSILILI